MSLLNHEAQAKIAAWRLKVADGTISQDEMKEAIILLCAGRVSSAAAASASKRKRAIAEIPAADDLLGEIEAS